MAEDTRICLGAIAGAHGVRGDVRLKSFCAEPADIAAYGPLETEGRDRRFAVRLLKPVKEGFAARLEGVATREAAEALRGTRLYVERTRLPRLPDDEFYHADLVGLEVRDTGGTRLGRVRAIHDHGAGDVIELHDGPAAGLMLPFTRWAVPTVDLAAGVMVADPPPEDEEEEP
ncbi:MAG: ribosome maturation factor RimM [Pseudomonadota bacterium]